MELGLEICTIIIFGSRIRPISNHKVAIENIIICIITNSCVEFTLKSNEQKNKQTKILILFKLNSINLNIEPLYKSLENPIILIRNRPNTL